MSAMVDLLRPDLPWLIEKVQSGTDISLGFAPVNDMDIASMARGILILVGDLIPQRFSSIPTPINSSVMSHTPPKFSVTAPATQSGLEIHVLQMIEIPLDLYHFLLSQLLLHVRFIDQITRGKRPSSMKRMCVGLRCAMKLSLLKNVEPIKLSRTPALLNISIDLELLRSNYFLFITL
jgi:hypothetical protein